MISRITTSTTTGIRFKVKRSSRTEEVVVVILEKSLKGTL